MGEQFRDNEALSRFELDIDGDVAFVSYRKSPGILTLTHTETPRAMRGRGIGSRVGLMAFDAVRAQGLKMRLRCGFLADLARQNPACHDLLDVH